ncbi:MAG TPA: hypothetical protein VJ437_03775 [Acidiferrobacterales bacterium]|nr:hypothetical protein [Acidiferrobacterales bacterium]
MKTAFAFLLLIAAVIAVSTLFRVGENPAVQPLTGLPWQIEILPGGEARVFGLVPGHSTLDEARGRFGMDMQIAVVAAPGEPGSLEAYSSNVTAGVITGKIILLADTDGETVARLRQRAVKTEYMDSTTKKFILHPDDLALAWRAPIAGITFIPSVSLDEKTALARFGVPNERIRVDDRVEHFLYPEKGLDLALDSKGKEVLQYIAPRQFARLREPLIRVAPVTTHRP